MAFNFSVPNPQISFTNLSPGYGPLGSSPALQYLAPSGPPPAPARPGGGLVNIPDPTGSGLPGAQYDPSTGHLLPIGPMGAQVNVPQAPGPSQSQDPSAFIASLLQGLQSSAPQLPMPQAPDFATLLAPYQQARDAANTSATAGKGVIGDAYNQSLSQIDALRAEYAQLQGQADAARAQQNSSVNNNLAQALAPLSAALNAQGVSDQRLQQQAATIQGTILGGQAAANQMAADRLTQAASDATSRKADSELVRESALGTLQNNLNDALNKIGLGESQARNTYQTQYQNALDQRAQQQAALDAASTKQNIAMGQQVNNFLGKLRDQGPAVGPDILQQMLNNYQGPRAKGALQTILEGDGTSNSNTGVAKTVDQALARIDPVIQAEAKQSGHTPLDRSVLESWVRTNFLPQHNLPADWQNQLQNYLSTISGGGY